MPVLVLAVGALTEVIGLDPDNPSDPPSVAGWNDHPDRQPADVITALHRAADRLDTVPPEPNPPDPIPDPVYAAGPGGPSATTFHQAPGTNPNHQVDSKETRNV